MSDLPITAPAPSQASDLEARLRGAAQHLPPGPPPELPETDVAYAVVDTPVGPLVLAASERGVVSCSYDGEGPVLDRVARRVSPRVLRGGRRLDPARRALDDYFSGRVRTLDLPVDLALAGGFAREVLAALADVPYGTTTTYGDVARRIGHPGASRAVGRALGANPVCVVVPCHRVVRGDGALSGYAGGPAAKELLLRLEGARP